MLKPPTAPSFKRPAGGIGTGSMGCGIACFTGSTTTCLTGSGAFTGGSSALMGSGDEGRSSRGEDITEGVLEPDLGRSPLLLGEDLIEEAELGLDLPNPAMCEMLAGVPRRGELLP